MSTPSLELETGSGAIAASGESGKAGRWRGWVIPAVALLSWWFVSRHVVAGHGMMTSPAQVLHTAIDQTRSGALWRALSASLARELTGFTLGASLGLLLGALLGVSPFANRLIGPSFNAFKQVSLFAWIPLISVWFGLGDVAKVVFLSLAALVPVRKFGDDEWLMFVTRNGTVKKTVMSAYGNVRQVGINAINISGVVLAHSAYAML